MTSLPTLTPEQRRHFLDFYEDAHRHAELSDMEFRTQEKIEAELDRLGVEHFRCGGTGLVGIVRNGEGPVLGFRADTDGLPIAEETGLPYASTDTQEKDGESLPTMHGCGHDTHFTSLLTATEVLLSHREAWNGTLVLLFQPAEETANGAAEMVDDGLWDKAPRPVAVIGQHVMPLPAGTVLLGEGNAMSLANSLRVTVHGKQAHGSQPEASVDPIVAMAAMILRLQTVVSREVAPQAAAVVTVGTVRAGLKENIIPASAEFTLNIRTPNEDVQKAVLEAVHRIIEAEATASRATVSFAEINHFPRCYNDPEQTARVRAALEAELGAEAVVNQEHAFTGSEDVGHLADVLGVPLVYWFFGAFDPSLFADGAMPAGNHHPGFAPDAASALDTGSRAAVAGILAYLGK